MKTIYTLILFALSIQFQPAIAQNKQYKTFTGTVIDRYGEALVGANVLATKKKRDHTGASTNEHGEFEFQTDTFDSLKITYLGFQTLYISYEDLLLDDLIMLEETNYRLDGVVITAKGGKWMNWRRVCQFGYPQNSRINLKVNHTNRNWKTFPNPTTDNIDITVDQELKGFVEVFGSTGARLATIAAESFPMSVSLENYPSGIFFLRYNSGGWVEDIGKVIKINQ